MFEFVGGYGEYRSATVGGELLAEATFDVLGAFRVTPSLWTYQSMVGWQSWSGGVRVDARPSPCFLGKIVLEAGVVADIVDLGAGDLSVSPSLSDVAGRNLSRRRLDFAVGVGVDSIPFVCEGCNYFFSGEALVGNFVPGAYRFYGGAVGESLSTTFVLSAEVATPFGAASAVRRSAERGWFADRCWIISYESPRFCHGLLSGKVGWESGFLGFAELLVRFKPLAEDYPFVASVGVWLPKDASLWQWRVGLGFYPGGRSCTAGRRANPNTLYPH